MNNINIKRPVISSVSTQNINKVLDQMIANDLQFTTTSGISPKLWTCRWYNADESEKSKLGYSKGEAVWLNTDTVEDVVSIELEKIRDVISHNPELSIKYAAVKDDKSEETEFLKKVVSGEITGNPDGMPLYYLGEITGRTRVKISLEDGNCDLPTDGSAKWKDFFVDNSRSKVAALILAKAREICAQQLSAHLVEYHLSGQNEVLKSISTEYLLADMSNLSGGFDFQNTAGKADTGLDYVLMFRGYSSGRSYKWFRIWNSGILEHGGILYKDDVAGMQDEYDSGIGVYKVNLKWTTSDTTAPGYTYSCSGQTYSADKFDYGYGFVNIPDAGNCIGGTECYSVQLTPVMQNTQSSEQTPTYPTSPVSRDSFGNYKYRSVGVVSMTNDSFRFTYESDVGGYSYYITGFSNNGQQRYRQ